MSGSRADSELVILLMNRAENDRESLRHQPVIRMFPMSTHIIVAVSKVYEIMCLRTRCDADGRA